jgi:uridine phosphorylase
MKIDFPGNIHERMGGQLSPGQVAKYVLVPGSEKRVEQLAGYWDVANEIAHHQGFLVYSGILNSTPITACSTGIGGYSASIAIDELAALGATTFIRVGVTGGIQPGFTVGDIVIASGAVRMDKTSEQYIFVDYPATADYEVTCALIAAAEKFGYPYHVGIAATSSSFYAGEGITCFNGYRNSKMETIESDLRSANVLDWDTETATIFTLCSLYGLRAGRANAIVDDPETGQYNPVGEKKVMEVATEAIRILSDWDEQKKASNRQFILPAFPERKLS